MALVIAWPRLLRAAGGQPPAFALPRGIVLLLAGLTAVIFLVEGAMLDWGALLLVDRGISTVEQAGLGYMMFSVAMKGNSARRCRSITFGYTAGASITLR